MNEQRFDKQALVLMVANLVIREVWVQRRSLVDPNNGWTASCVQGYGGRLAPVSNYIIHIMIIMKIE